MERRVLYLKTRFALLEMDAMEFKKRIKIIQWIVSSLGLP